MPLKALLSKKGYDVDLVESVQEAIVKCTDSIDYIVITTDYNMPQGNGDMLFSYLDASRFKGIKILISGDISCQQIADKYDAYFLEKPINLQYLYNILDGD